MEELKKGSDTADEMKQKISDYEVEIEKLKASAELAKKEFILKQKLREIGVIDEEILKSMNEAIVAIAVGGQSYRIRSWSTQSETSREQSVRGI